VLAAFLTGVTFLAVTRLWLWLADWIADVGIALADAALVELVVLELGQIDDLDRDPDLVVFAPAQVAVLDELREILAPPFTDLPESFEIVL
jgi:hypothetical protein